jgi:hypothetical protein
MYMYGATADIKDGYVEAFYSATNNVTWLQNVQKYNVSEANVAVL